MAWTDSVSQSHKSIACVRNGGQNINTRSRCRRMAVRIRCRNSCQWKKTENCPQVRVVLTRGCRFDEGAGWVSGADAVTANEKELQELCRCH